MNKAFVKESDQDDDDAPPGAPSLPPGTRNYMTRRGFEILKAELDQLVRDERPRLVETIRWAASNGDRSENGDYIYGKKRLREIDRRIRFLTKRLEIAEVTDPSALTLPLFRVALNPRFTRPFYAVPRTSAARTASG